MDFAFVSEHDINTAVEYSEILPKNVIPSILDELTTMSKEIALNGDIV